LSATRAAVEEGIVPGGGITLLRCREVIKDLKLEGDEKTGAMIVYRALEEPLRQIANNAGIEGSVVVARALQEKDNIGFNAETLQWEDLTESGILDPVKVTRSALQNAASIGAMILTTEVSITDLPEKEKESMPGMGAGMGGMDY
jgi:Chaperonin GroEL (HSP60 family)